MPDHPEIPEIRVGQTTWPMSRAEFARRFRQRFFDPNFDVATADIKRLIEIGWKNYCETHKAPRTRKAGPGFADPDYELSVEWLDTRRRIQEAQQQHDDKSLPARALVICGSSRNDKTCPGEMSKTWRLTSIAAEVLEGRKFAVDVLDLSTLTSEFQRLIHPCKACVSTAMPLCHWPCSCYPNHALGQANDWMNDIYPLWVASHGILIVTPVYWYQAPSGLKLMIERLVCADGGNPDPTTTQGKDPKLAKQLELKGWDYPRHLAGRAFGIVVHGDAAGVGTLRRSLADWLTDMKLIQAGGGSTLDRYVGYYEPYATSHEALDRDTSLQEEVRNVARSLANKVTAIRAGRQEPDAKLEEPRAK